MQLHNMYTVTTPPAFSHGDCYPLADEETEAQSIKYEAQSMQLGSDRAQTPTGTCL